MSTTSSTDRIEKQIDLAAPPSRVWRALTDHREFSQWFRVDLESPFEVGKESGGRINYPGYEHLTMVVRVVEITPERRFVFMWHPGDPVRDTEGEPETRVEFTLTPSQRGTLVTVVETGFDALPPERRAEAYRLNDEGWSEQMQNIREHIEGD